MSKDLEYICKTDTGLKYLVCMIEEAYLVLQKFRKKYPCFSFSLWLGDHVNVGLVDFNCAGWRHAARSIIIMTYNGREGDVVF